AERAATSGPTHEPPAPTPESLDRLDQQLERTRDRERRSLAELTRAQTSLHEFEELLGAGVCPRCGQAVRSSEFEPHRDEAAALERRAEEEHRAAGTDRSRIEEIRKARERYERARDAWLRVETERAATAIALQGAEARWRETEAAVRQSATVVEDARTRVAECGPVELRERTLRAEVDSAESARRLCVARVEQATLAAEQVRAAESASEVLRAEVDRIDRETAAGRLRTEARGRRIGELRESLTGADERARELRAAEDRWAARVAAVEVDQRALVRVDTRLDEAVRRLATAEKGRAERSRRVAEAVDLEAKAAWVAGPFRLAVLTMEQKLLAHAQAAFERNFARYFAALIEDPSLVARTDVAFTPAVAIEGEWTPAEALSGGERTSLALAFRLALAQVVRSLGNLRLETVLLDEPTDGFSPEQVVRMGELLGELDLPQVILVSHEDELAGIADRVIRVEKVEGASVLRTGANAAPADRGTEGAPP
ncbi:MAG: hypothetical protein WBS16_04455, partial [Thermoplasmata archaeon]